MTRVGDTLDITPFMRISIHAISVLMLLFATSTVSAAIVTPDSYLPLDQKSITEFGVSDKFGDMTAESFLKMTPKQYKAITGKRMKLKERIAMKLMQKRLKRQLKKQKNKRETFGTQATQELSNRMILAIILILIGGIVAGVVGGIIGIAGAIVGIAGLILLVLELLQLF